jgi:hypothetical protein
MVPLSEVPASIFAFSERSMASMSRLKNSLQNNISLPVPLLETVTKKKQKYKPRLIQKYEPGEDSNLSLLEEARPAAFDH